MRDGEISATTRHTGTGGTGSASGSAVPTDTSADVLAKQFEVLRAMGLEGRARLTFSLIDNATELALAGIRAREPGLSDQREQWLLMARRYGRDFALSVLGDEPPRR